MPDFPMDEVDVHGLERHLRSVVQSTSSPFTLTGQDQELDGEQWNISMEISTSSLAFEAFLNGTFNKRRVFDIKMPDISRWPADQLPSEYCVVHEAANSRATSLRIRGFGQDTPPQVGMLFSIMQQGLRRLYQVSAVTVDGGDFEEYQETATIQFHPRLRAGAIVGSFVDFIAPSMTAKATAPAPVGISWAVVRTSLEIEEAL